MHRGVESGEIFSPALKKLGRPAGQNLVGLVAPLWITHTLPALFARDII